MPPPPNSSTSILNGTDRAITLSIPLRHWQNQLLKRCTSILLMQIMDSGERKCPYAKIYKFFLCTFVFRTCGPITQFWSGTDTWTLGCQVRILPRYLDIYLRSSLLSSLCVQALRRVNSKSSESCKMSTGFVVSELILNQNKTVHFSPRITNFMGQSPSSEANSHSAKIFHTFMETEGSLPRSLARHWYFSWARCSQLISSHPVHLRSILTLPSHLRLGLPSALFPSGFPTKMY
jgi:hypothetical protein